MKNPADRPGFFVISESAAAAGSGRALQIVQAARQLGAIERL